MNYTNKNYTAEVQHLIKAIIDNLIKRYGEYQTDWDMLIELLADNLQLYSKCKKSVKENGIYNSENGRKNPLLSTMKDLQATILKQIQHLGSSPYAESKIKQTKEDDTEDFIEDLLK